MWAILYYGLSEADANAIERNVVAPDGQRIRMEFCRHWESAEEHCAGHTGFDVIILDSRVSEATSILERLKHLQPDSSLVVMSHYSDRNQSAEFLRMGAHEVVHQADQTSAYLQRAINHAIERGQLQRDLQHLSSIVGASSDFIGTCDREGRMISLNAAARQMCGIDGQWNVARMRIEDFHPRWAVEKIRSVAIPTAEKTGHWQGETALIRSNGSELPVSQQIIAHRSSNGTVKYYSTVMRDVSHFKAVEADLIRARSQAEEADQVKSRFLAHMSHELRSPLTAILGFCDMLQSQTDLSRLQEIADTIHRNGSHLLEIINDILDLSRIEAQMLTIRSEEFLLAEVVRELRSLFELPDEDDNNAFETILETPVSKTLKTDPLRLKQILSNLLSNAFKYAPDGIKELRIRTTPDGEIAFAVRDTGPGIAETELQQIFAPFSRLVHDEDTGVAGTGLGLAIGRRLAELLGGKLSVESQLGQGTTFTLTLPRSCMIAGETIDSIANEVRKPTRSLPVEDTAPTSRPPGRVLVADDRRDVWRVVEHFLKKAGYEAVIAKNGREAIDEIESAATEGQEFEAVLMDMQMPVLSGYEAVRELRANGFRQPIIALTASAMKGDRAKCLEAGCDDYLPKPIDGKALLDKVRKLLDDANRE
ncbi:ATP-binding protein [Thalassoroseus pseudoceratinae]|uniref:ATP-binding protein n=1 Tax=Thalassoroseus pseudoceratinae TaxID=2713176 RepID=UPI00141D9D5F|nr:ATP-binding protein [Thalassoroseus pseudoceratinae]